MSADVLRWILPQTALDHSYAELAADGARHREGIVLWAGRSACDGDKRPVARITHVLLLRGPGVRRGFGYISIAPELLNDVTDALAAGGDDLYVVGQIHGHPPGVPTDLSDVDIAYGIRTPQYLSVVAPDFGMSSPARIEDCGVHVFEPHAGWRRLASSEVAARLDIQEANMEDVTCLAVGDHGNG